MGGTPAGTGGRLALAGLAVLAGTALQLTRAELQSPVIAGAFLVLAAALGWAGRRRTPVLLLAVALGAFAAAEWRAGWRLQQALPAALEGRDLQLVGVVASLPREGLTGTRFEFEVEGATLDGRPVAVPPRLALAWFRGVDADALLAAPGQRLEPGQRWRLTARLRQPHGTLNPGGFDLELWLWERGLRATGYVRDRAGDRPVLLATAQGQAVDRLRQRLRDAITARVADGRTAGVLTALVVGDQAAIEREDWDLFRATGIAHLMSISGLHITMFAWLAAGLVGRAWRLAPRAMLWLPAPSAARWGGLALAAAYAALAGWGVPAQRTLWMLAAVAALGQAGVRWPGPMVLLAAAVLVAVLDPWALLQPGFWLSFGAVALLMASDRPAPAGAGRLVTALRQGLRTQAVATVGLAPLTLLFFQQVSLVGFAANLVAIPLVTLVVTPLALAGALLPVLWAPAAWALQGLVAVLEPLGTLPVWSAAAAPVWAGAAGLLGGMILVLRLPWRLRWLGLPLMLPLLAPLPERPAPGRFELLAVDVGQGTAVLLRTTRHLLVYDAGPAWSPEADAGGRVLLPLLRWRGEDRIHRLVLSHRDSDHVGGARSLLEGIAVDSVWHTLEASHPLIGAMTRHEACRAGQVWAWDGVRFTVLHPADPEAPVARPNQRSCTLRVEDAAGRSVLLTGDLESAQEAALALADPATLRSTVLMVPHHGSKTSSSPVFLDAVAPQIAFAQAGYRSRFGHPAPEVLARYAERGITVVRSDRCGAWAWQGDGPGVCTRQSRRRYWHHPDGPVLASGAQNTVRGN